MTYREIALVGLGDVVRLRLPPSPACTSLGIAGQVPLVLVLAEGAQLLTDTWERAHRITHADAGLITWEREPLVFKAAVEPGGPAKITDLDFTDRTDVRPAVWRRNPIRVITRHAITWSLHRDSGGFWLLREHDGRIHVGPRPHSQIDAHDEVSHRALLDAIERGEAY